MRLGNSKMWRDGYAWGARDYGPGLCKRLDQEVDVTELSRVVFGPLAKSASVVIARTLTVKCSRRHTISDFLPPVSFELGSKEKGMKQL
jgi:hypothetical protein